MLNSEFERLGWPYATHYDFGGLALALSGRLCEALAVYKREIDRRDTAGDRPFATIYRFTLAEIHIRILTSKEKAAAAVIFKTLWTILGIRLFAAGTGAGPAPAGGERGVTMARINAEIREGRAAQGAMNSNTTTIAFMHG
jgi:hypothetical protein